jgi:hypothetical protein
MDINYIVDAKSEYTKQLQTLLVPRIYEGIESIYDDANYNNTMNVLHTFQKLLREIPKWNKDIIDGETNRILEVTQCEWLENLVTAVFVSNTKILTAIKIKDHDGKIDITIPRLSHFIHRCYVEVARELYKNPYLLDKTNNSVKEKQQNLRETLGIIENCVEDAIRSLLPIQSLLKEYLGNININMDKQIGGDEEEQDDIDEVDDNEQDVDKNEEDIEKDDEEDIEQDDEQDGENEIDDNKKMKMESNKVDKEVELEGGEKQSIEKSRSKYKVNELEEDIEESDNNEIIVDDKEDIVVDDIDFENSESDDEEEQEVSKDDKEKNITEEVEKKEQIKHVKIDNHLLPRNLQRKPESVDQVGSSRKKEQDDESVEENDSIGDEVSSINDTEKHVEDDTRSVNSEFISNGLKKIKKKKPKLILRKKVPVEQNIERPRVESNNRYDFW